MVELDVVLDDLSRAESVPRAVDGAFVFLFDSQKLGDDFPFVELLLEQELMAFFFLFVLLDSV